MKFLIWLSSECASLAETIEAMQGKGHEVGILLIQDGVFLADKGCPHSKEVVDLGVKIYASKAHVEERGIESRLIPKVSLVDYPSIVDLMMETYDRVVSV
jgi:sulfur relay protein TusB/DsrH